MQAINSKIILGTKLWFHTFKRLLEIKFCQNYFVSSYVYYYLW
jgi:hypothetical protein